jgi:AcrR family transcriptional regulator
VRHPGPAKPRFFVSEDDPPSKRAVLAAALGLFVKHGLSATNVRMIASEAGYTNPAMFKFFDSKEALALHLFERCYERLHRAVGAAAARTPSSAAVGAVLDAFLAAMDEDLEAVLFVQDTLRELWPRSSPALRRRSIIRALRELLARGIREGVVTGYASSDVPVAALVGLVAQLGRMLYFGEIQGPARARRGELALALDRMLKG